MTAMHVIIGELMPKSIALQRSESTALLIGRPMTFFALVFSPLIWLLNGIGNFLLGLLGFHAAEGHEQVHSPEELDLIFAESHLGGELNQTEFEILHRVVRFSDTIARAIMVPRLEMQTLPVNITHGMLTRFLKSRPHTRIPVYRDTLDQILGIVNSKDLEHLINRELAREVERLKLAASAGDNGKHKADLHQTDEEKLLDLTPLLLDAAFVPETIRVEGLLAELKKHRQQMAIVVDEYGGTVGMIALADILDEICGELPDEGEESEPEIMERPDGSIQLAGRVSINEVNELLGLDFPTEEAVTMAGLALSELGRIASVDDEVEINGLRIRVEGIDRVRITRLGLYLPAQEDSGEEE
jgi:CBS domain containing-hemolysin-like protein